MHEGEGSGVCASKHSSNHKYAAEGNILHAWHAMRSEEEEEEEKEEEEWQALPPFFLLLLLVYAPASLSFSTRDKSHMNNTSKRLDFALLSTGASYDQTHTNESTTKTMKTHYYLSFSFLL